ncbi:MAG TPA: hypothetical protein VL337_17495 [Acidimicrobiales bacterium]|nr:hypothetical protein [Acidimicrobiales bacterium]
MAEDRINDLRREAAGRSSGRRWFRRRPPAADPAVAPVALPVVGEEPDELRQTA